jgi:hypothetical protein
VSPFSRPDIVPASDSIVKQTTDEIRRAVLCCCWPALYLVQLLAVRRNDAARPTATNPNQTSHATEVSK